MPIRNFVHDEKTSEIPRPIFTILKLIFKYTDFRTLTVHKIRQLNTRQRRVARVMVIPVITVVVANG